MAQPGDNNNSNSNSNSNNKKKKKRNILLDWRLWLVFLLSAFLTLSGLSFAFGFAVIQKALTDPGTVALVGVLGTAGGLAVKFIAPIWEELKKLKGEAEMAKAEAVSAKTIVREGNEKTEDNKQSVYYLEKSYEALSRSNSTLGGAYNRLVDDLQAERDKFEARTDKLEAQLVVITEQNNARQLELYDMKETHKRDIAELKEEHKRQLAENTEQIKGLLKENTELKKRVTDLELELQKLKLENEYLQDENKGLKEMRRRVTDNLDPGNLPGEGEAK